MKRFHYFLSGMAAAILLVCLWGCSPTEPPETTPSTLPTTLPPETIEPLVTAPPILSWNIPDYPRMSYEEYFSTAHIYGYTPIDEDPKTYYYSFAWDNGTDSCELWFQDGKLLAGDSIKNRYVEVGTDTYGKDDIIATCNEEWVFLVLDSKELIRMDYYGKNKETLFVDEKSTLGEVYIRDNCVLFFTAGCEEGYGIYRLYLPEMKLDLLVTSESQINLQDPYSSHEVAWYIRNPEFEELYQSILNDPPPPYDEMIASNAPQIALNISYDYHIPMELDYYYNSLTGETKQREVFAERCDWTARAWWLEE